MSNHRSTRPRNRLAVCPMCDGSLDFDRNAVTSDNRFIYRSRRCKECGVVWHTKQPPEEITGRESPHSGNTDGVLAVSL